MPTICIIRSEDILPNERVQVPGMKIKESCDRNGEHNMTPFRSKLCSGNGDTIMSHIKSLLHPDLCSEIASSHLASPLVCKRSGF